MRGFRRCSQHLYFTPRTKATSEIKRVSAWPWSHLMWRLRWIGASNIEGTRGGYFGLYVEPP